MASGVSVERSAVQGGIGCCQTSIHELGASASQLKREYAQAGAGGWRDKQYAALGGIVEECCSALTKPINDLNDCIRSLQELLAQIDRYEGTSIR